MILSLCLLVSGCAVVQTDYNYDAGYDFSGLQQYTWLEMPIDFQIDHFSMQHIKTAIDRQLKIKGYTLTERTAIRRRSASARLIYHHHDRHKDRPPDLAGLCQRRRRANPVNPGKSRKNQPDRRHSPRQLPTGLGLQFAQPVAVGEFVMPDLIRHPERYTLDPGSSPG
jgi:hypothetical protein